jgi:hypothetical protein
MIKGKRHTEQVNVDMERDKKFLTDLDRLPVIGYSPKVAKVLSQKPKKKGGK